MRLPLVFALFLIPCCLQAATVETRFEFVPGESDFEHAGSWSGGVYGQLQGSFRFLFDTDTKIGTIDQIDVKVTDVEYWRWNNSQREPWTPPAGSSLYEFEGKELADAVFVDLEGKQTTQEPDGRHLLQVGPLSPFDPEHPAWGLADPWLRLRLEIVGSSVNVTSVSIPGPIDSPTASIEARAVAVPEASTLALMLLGGVSLLTRAAYRRRVS